MVNSRLFWLCVVLSNFTFVQDNVINFELIDKRNTIYGALTNFLVYIHESSLWNISSIIVSVEIFFIYQITTAKIRIKNIELLACCYLKIFMEITFLEYELNVIWNIIFLDSV